MPRIKSGSIIQQTRALRERPLTQTVPVSGSAAVPPGYVRFPLKSVSIYDKAQVLSYQHYKPVFIERAGLRRRAYWIHRSILPELAQWLDLRVFPLEELVDDEPSREVTAGSGSLPKIHGPHRPGSG